MHASKCQLVFIIIPNNLLHVGNNTLKEPVCSEKEQESRLKIGPSKYPITVSIMMLHLYMYYTGGTRLHSSTCYFGGTRIRDAQECIKVAFFLIRYGTQSL